MALDMIDAARRISDENGVSITLRIGIASGPVLAGVIGAKRLIYDVWGDTVNLASRLENQSQPNGILVSELTQIRLGDAFRLEPHGSIDIKGYGTVQTWFLRGPRNDWNPEPALEEAPLSAPAGEVRGFRRALRGLGANSQ
jgi:adenylate cyclase